MTKRSWAFALKGAACVAAALAVAGCSRTTSSSSGSDLVVEGNTLVIYVSVPAHVGSDPAAQDVFDAEKLAYLRNYKEVKDYKVLAREVSDAKLSDNAREAIQDGTAIAYIGELAPGASDQTVGITNALDLLQVSPTDTALELGQHTSAVSGSPQSLFQSWSSIGRTFARVVPTSAQEASAQVAEMKSLGVSSLYVSDDGSDYGRAIALAVRDDARSAGISLTASMTGAGGIFYGVQSPAQGAKFFTHAASVAPGAKLFGPSSLNSGLFTAAVSASLPNLYVTIPGFMPSQLNAAGKSFDAAFASAYGHKPNVEAIFGYEAMSSVLAALEQAGHAADKRATVVGDYLKLSQPDSVLGSYKIDGDGNTSLDAFVIAHLSGGALVPFKAAPAEG